MVNPLERGFPARAFIFCRGPGFISQDGNELGVFGGDIDPIFSSGLEADINTLYIRNNGELYRKVGSGNKAWSKIMYDPLTRAKFTEDFLPTGFSPYFDDKQWLVAINGNGSSVLGQALNGGQIRIQAGAANNRYGELINALDTVDPVKDIILNFRGKYDVTSNLFSTVGLWQDSGHAAYFMINDGGTKFETHVEGSSGTTDVDTSINLDTNWHDFKIVSSSSQVEFWMDHTLEVTTTTNLPTDLFRLDFWVQSKAGGTTRAFFLDYIDLESQRDT